MKISDNLLKTNFKRPSLPQHFGKLIFGRNLLHGVDLGGKLILFIFIYCILKKFTIRYLIAIYIQLISVFSRIKRPISHTFDE